MKFYVSGPITGMKDLNKASFDAEEKRLRALGFDVFNPQSIKPPKLSLDGRALWQYYMRECVKNIPDRDTIVMLPGWQASDGANEERRIAIMLGLHVAYSETAFESHC